MHFSSELLEIEGRGRVEAARVRLGDGRVERIACDGILLSGRFVPESSLVRLSHLELDPASGGPRIDQFGRCSDPPISPPATCSGRSDRRLVVPRGTKDRRPAGRRPAGRTAGRRARYRHRLQRSAQAVRAAAAAGRSDTRPGASAATRKRGRQRTPADTGRWSPGVGTRPVLPAGAPPAGAAGRPAPTAGHPAPGSRLPHLRPLNREENRPCESPPSTREPPVPACWSPARTAAPIFSWRCVTSNTIRSPAGSSTIRWNCWPTCNAAWRPAAGSTPSASPTRAKAAWPGTPAAASRCRR